MKLVDRINMNAKNMSLVNDFSFTNYAPNVYLCNRCQQEIKLYQARVLYCRKCHIGRLHPKYNFTLDRIVDN